ncbi:iron ABC transporter permease [Paenibacillus caui]|uniref:iron ABC transporter permease n=1 Tax=Paenibacillus caui TaxID=2873927 RepID=UPI001CA9BF1D|nr:iron ABC transporter permease [Paenibacillus caui]
MIRRKLEVAAASGTPEQAQTPSVPAGHASRGVLFIVFLAGPLLLLLIGMVQITQGTADVRLGTIREALFHLDPEDPLQQIVRGVRMPRAVMGLVAGAALAVSGVLLQTLTRNPLASAGTLGINSGAYLAVIVSAIFFPSLGSSSPLLSASLGGLLAGGIVFLLAGSKRISPIRLALGGMALSLVLSSITGTLQLLYENETSGLFLWGSGTLVQNDWHNPASTWGWIAGGIAISLGFSRNLDILLMDEAVGRSLGQRIALTRTLSVLLAVLLASVAVSAVGPIGFVGLLAPHLLRLMGIRRHLLLLPAAAIWGGVVLMTADLGVLVLEPVFGILPAGAVTALLGAPWLVWLVYRMKPSRGDVQGSGSGMTLGWLRRVPYGAAVLTAVLLLAAGFLAGLMLGSKTLTLPETLSALTGGGSKLVRYMVIDTRLPRLLVACLAGASLAVSGALLQGVVRNPLADPSVIGITSGAGLGALTVMMLVPGLSAAFVPGTAFLGAMACAAAIYLFTRKGGVEPAKVALIGMAISAFCAAGIQALVVKAQLRVASLLVWLSGSTYARSWDELQMLFIWPLALLPLAWWIARRLDLLALGDAAAIGLGVKPDRVRALAGLIGAALAASAVATVGTVGFVGLLAPHAARVLAPSGTRKLTVLAALLGALFLLLADLVGRTVLAPKEIPSGLVVAVLGAPYFLWLMKSAGSRRT